jgi:purine-binding chemotaxis protein CheW
MNLMTQRRDTIMKLLLFQLGDQEYAIDTKTVISIEKIDQIRKISQSPIIDGLAEFRGRTSVIINMKAALSIRNQREYKNEERVIVCDFKSELLGLRVDRVRTLLDVKEETIQPFMSQPEFVKGAFLEEEEAITVLNINKLIEDIQ